MRDSAWCVTRGCTTGWFDWVHGALWLLPDSLVRIRLSLAETRVHGYGPTVPTPVPRADPAAFDTARILAGHRTNKVMMLRDIAHARPFTGVTAHGLRIVMRDGTRHKLLWLTRDPAYRILSVELAALVPEA